MVGLSSDLGDSGEKVASTASTSREGTAKIESISQDGTAKVSTAPFPCPAEASTSGVAGTTTGRTRNSEAGPTPPKSKRIKAMIPPGSTFEQAEDKMLGVILRQDNPYKLLTRIKIYWIRNELMKLLEATVIRQNGHVPCFQESGQQNCRFHLSCLDSSSYEWVENDVSFLDLTEDDTKLRIQLVRPSEVPKLKRAQVYITGPLGSPCCLLVRTATSVPKGGRCDISKMPQTGNCFFWGNDKDTAAAIKAADNRLFFGLSRVTFKVSRGADQSGVDTESLYYICCNQSCRRQSQRQRGLAVSRHC